MAQSVREFASHADGWAFEPQPRQTQVIKSSKLVVTAPLLNAQQQVWVSRVLGNGHYKCFFCFTVGAARQRILIAQWPWVPSIGQNFQPFTGNGDVSILEWDGHPQTNQTTLPVSWKAVSTKNKDMYIIWKFGREIIYNAWKWRTWYWVCGARDRRMRKSSRREGTSLGFQKKLDQGILIKSITKTHWQIR